MKNHKKLFKVLKIILIIIGLYYGYKLIYPWLDPEVEFARNLAYSYLDENYDGLDFRLKFKSSGDKTTVGGIFFPSVHKDKGTKQFVFEVSAKGIPFKTSLRVFVNKEDNSINEVTEKSATSSDRSFKRLYNYYVDYSKYFKDKKEYKLQYGPDVCIISPKRLIEEEQLVSDVLNIINQDKNMNTGVYTYMKFSDGDIRLNYLDTGYDSIMNYIHSLKDINDYLVSKGYNVSINYTPDFSRENIKYSPVIKINEKSDEEKNQSLIDDVRSIIEKYYGNSYNRFILSFDGYEVYIFDN